MIKNKLNTFYANNRYMRALQIHATDLKATSAGVVKFYDSRNYYVFSGSVRFEFVPTSAR